MGLRLFLPNSISKNIYNFEDWGQVPYKEALEKQLGTLNTIFTEQKPGTIIFCTHPPVVTCGRVTTNEDISGWTGEIVEVSRGGRATYHGPSQLVVYPIINLKIPSPHRPRGEVVGFLRQLENSIVMTLKNFDIDAIGRSLQTKSDSNSKEDETGVWVTIDGSHYNRKIASLGIAVKNWITYHGAAINLKNDSQAFSGIKPCGFQTNVMISLEEILKIKDPNFVYSPALENEFKKKLIENLFNYL